MGNWQYIALLGAVLVVLAIIMPRNKASVSQKSIATDEIEQLELSLTQFMENMEQEHEEVVKMLSTSLQSIKEENQLKNEKIANLEKKCEQLEQQLSVLSHQSTALEAKLSVFPTFMSEQQQLAKQAYDQTQSSQLQQEIVKMNGIHTRFSEIFDMYEAGKSIEAIAKKIGKTKGEVQLIIQLAEQEEKAQHG